MTTYIIPVTLSGTSGTGLPPKFMSRPLVRCNPGVSAPRHAAQRPRAIEGNSERAKEIERRLAYDT